MALDWAAMDLHDALRAAAVGVPYRLPQIPQAQLMDLICRMYRRRNGAHPTHEQMWQQWRGEFFLMYCDAQLACYRQQRHYALPAPKG